MQMEVNKNLEPISSKRYHLSDYRNLLTLQSPRRLIFRLLPASVSTLSTGELLQSHGFKYSVLTFDSQIVSPAQISPLHTRPVYSTASSVLSLGCFIGTSNLPCLKN